MNILTDSDLALTEDDYRDAKKRLKRMRDRVRSAFTGMYDNYLMYTDVQPKYYRKIKTPTDVN